MLEQEEPNGTLRRDSIMNFEENAILIYKDLYGVVKSVEGRYVTFVYVDTNKEETVHYELLHVVHLVFKKQPGTYKHWTKKDILFLKKNIHLPNENLARLLGRTPTAVADKKTKHRL